jgi:penicillin-binding protein 2
LFIAYAPAESPKIALALIVENGGFGAQAAAPIARAVLDLHLMGRVRSDRKSQPAPVLVEIDEAELRDVPAERPPPGVAPALPGPVVEPSEQDLTEAPPP